MTLPQKRSKEYPDPPPRKKKHLNTTAAKNLWNSSHHLFLIDFCCNFYNIMIVLIIFDILIEKLKNAVRFEKKRFDKVKES